MFSELRSIRTVEINQWDGSLIITSQWVMMLLGMPIVTSQWVMMLLEMPILTPQWVMTLLESEYRVGTVGYILVTYDNI